MIDLSRVTLRNNKVKGLRKPYCASMVYHNLKGIYLQPLFYPEDVLIISLALIKGIRSCKVPLMAHHCPV
jgi:hypothetical protein